MADFDERDILEGELPSLDGGDGLPSLDGGAEGPQPELPAMPGPALPPIDALLGESGGGAVSTEVTESVEPVAAGDGPEPVEVVSPAAEVEVDVSAAADDAPSLAGDSEQVESSALSDTPVPAEAPDPAGGTAPVRSPGAAEAGPAGKAPQAPGVDATPPAFEKPGKKRNLKPIVIGVGAVAALAFGAYTFIHDWSDPTCTEPAICSICGRVDGDPLGHDWVEPTCTEPASCERCGERGEPALGHEMDAETKRVVEKSTCTKQGTAEGTCARCGEPIEESLPLADHTPGSWKTVSEPTVSASGDVTPGRREQACKACGEVLDSEEVTIEVTFSQKNALDRAHSYLDTMPFSREGLIEQLEFEGYSTEDATFAADYCGADWYEQAALEAEDYLDFMSFSHSGLVDQLMFEGYTRDQAEYGVSQTGL